MATAPKAKTRPVQVQPVQERKEEKKRGHSKKKKEEIVWVELVPRKADSKLLTELMRIMHASISQHSPAAAAADDSDVDGDDVEAELPEMIVSRPSVKIFYRFAPIHANIVAATIIQALPLKVKITKTVRADKHPAFMLLMESENMTELHAHLAKLAPSVAAPPDGKFRAYMVMAKWDRQNEPSTRALALLLEQLQCMIGRELTISGFTLTIV